MRAAKIGELTVENSYRCKRKKYEGVYGVDPRLIEMALPGGAADAPRATGVDAGDPPEECGGCGRAELDRAGWGGGLGRGRPLG